MEGKGSESGFLKSWIRSPLKISHLTSFYTAYGIRIWFLCRVGSRLGSWFTSQLWLVRFWLFLLVRSGSVDPKPDLQPRLHQSNIGGNKIYIQFVCLLCSRSKHMINIALFLKIYYYYYYCHNTQSTIVGNNILFFAQGVLTILIFMVYFHDKSSPRI